MINTTENCLNALRELCRKPGFVQVLAYYSLRFHWINPWGGSVKSQDRYRPPTRREFALLEHLCFEQNPDCRPLDANELQEYLDDADRLLAELHEAVNGRFLTKMRFDDNGVFDVANSVGDGMSEVLFYGSDTEYSYQFSEFAIEKYSKESQWLHERMGFSFEELMAVVKCISDCWNKRIFANGLSFVSAARNTKLDLVNALTLEIKGICASTNLSDELIETIVRLFSFSPPLRELPVWNELPTTVIRPLIEKGTTIVLSHPYFLLRALYYNPTFWIREKDKQYASNILPAHRKDYTEKFVFERMQTLFGTKDVLRDVKIKKVKGGDITDIDVLVLWRSFALIIQVKAKTITQSALQGEMQKIQDDFQKAVYNSYEQGVVCHKAISEPADYKFFLENKEIIIRESPRKVYVLCLAGDGYPSVHMQTRFLGNIQGEKDRPYPLVFDNFSFDTVVRALNHPFQFVHYINTLYNMERKDLLAYESPNAILGAFLENNLLPAQQMIYSGEITGALFDTSCSKVVDDAADLYAQGRTETLMVDSAISRTMKTWIGRYIFGSFNSSTDRFALMMYFTLAQIPATILSRFDKECERAVSVARSSGAVQYVQIYIGVNDTALVLVFMEKYDSVVCNDELIKAVETEMEKKRHKVYFAIAVDAEKVYPVGFYSAWDAKHSNENG